MWAQVILINMIIIRQPLKLKCPKGFFADQLLIHMHHPMSQANRGKNDAGLHSDGLASEFIPAIICNDCQLDFLDLIAAFPQPAH